MHLQIETNLIRSNVLIQKEKFYNFFSHKENAVIERKYSQEQKYKYQTEIKELIHEWLKYEKELDNQNHLDTPTKEYFQLDKLISFKKQDFRSYQIQKNHEKDRQRFLSSQIIKYLCKSHPIFRRINFNLTETLINIGTFKVYKKNNQIPYIFYEEKSKNLCNERKKLGIIMYGRVKLSDKVTNFEKIIDQSDSLGQHGIETLNIKFSDYRNIKVKVLDEQVALLWINKNNYEILFKQSVKCGLKEDIKKFESHLRISWIKKSIMKD